MSTEMMIPVPRFGRRITDGIKNCILDFMEGTRH